MAMTVPLRSRPPSARLLDGAALCILALVAAIAAATFRDYGLGWDDFTHSQYGNLLLSFYESGFKDTRAFSFVNLYLYGGGFDMAAALLSKLLALDLFETRRLFGAAVGLIGLAVTWRLGRRIGGPLAGLLALALLAACPLFYGHMFINPKDAPFATAMAVLLMGVVRALEDYPTPRASTRVILALGLGCSVGSRVMAGFGLIEAAAALALLFALDARGLGGRAASRRLGRFLLALLPAFVAGYALMALIWPWAVLDPLNPFRAVEYFAHFFETPWRELFEGQLIDVPDMPRSYLPVLLGLKLPELFLLLAAGGADITPQRRAILACVIAAALLPIVVTVATRPAMYNGIRQFVFVTPPLAVLGGLAGAWLAARLMRHGRAALAGGAAVALAGLASPVFEMIRLHPYEYVHFNRIAGGVPGAASRFMLDYWGLAFKQASQRLLAATRDQPPPAGRKWKVAACGPHPPAEIALGDRFEISWDPAGADFAMSLGTFYCAALDAPVIAAKQRDGVSFARVYDLRGRTIKSLFTVPPLVPEQHAPPPS
jgi:hypothetical protein